MEDAENKKFNKETKEEKEPKEFIINNICNRKVLLNKSMGCTVTFKNFRYQI